MSRKSIFEILSENIDYTREIRTIWRLFINDVKISIPRKGIYGIKGHNVSILEAVSKYSFNYWKSRNRCISPSDMMERLEINEKMIMNLNGFCNEMINVLEFIVNIVRLCDVSLKYKDVSSSSNYRLMKENINWLIEHFGYVTYYCEDEEYLKIIEKNPAATAVAEISTSETAKKIMQYNHYTLKGDIEKKKDIIVSLGKELEPKRESLKKIDSSLTSDVFFMLNNMNLRHNNLDSKNKNNYQEFIAKMNKNDLENWYDETYQMILLANLLLDNIERQEKVNILKKSCDES